MADKKYLDLNGLGYTIRKMDNKKADIESPALTGTPTAPTAASGTATPQIATTEFVNNELKDKQDKLIAGNNITIDEETNTISSSDGGSSIEVNPAINSGTKIADITVDDNKKTIYIPSTYLDKTYTGENILAGKLTVGSCSTNTSNAYLHQRNVSNAGATSIVTGTPYNGASFAVSGDGSASFQHKTYTNSSAGGARNAAVLRFYGTQDKKGGALQFAINTGTSATPTEAMYKNVAMVDDIPVYKAGDNITIDDNNVISATGGGGGGDVPDEVVLWTLPKEGIVATKNTAIYQHEKYDILNTTNKTVFGAINELVARHVCCTQEEYDEMTDDQKANTFFYIIEEE